MGWCEFPPFFCAASTKTAQDVISSLLDANLPPHAFETKMLPNNFDDMALADLNSAETLIEVFLDDFIACTDTMASKTILKMITHEMLNGIHSIFPPRDTTGHTGVDPISEKKIEKLQNGCGNTQKKFWAGSLMEPTTRSSYQLPRLKKWLQPLNRSTKRRRSESKTSRKLQDHCITRQWAYPEDVGYSPLSGKP